MFFLVFSAIIYFIFNKSRIAPPTAVSALRGVEVVCALCAVCEGIVAKKLGAGMDTNTSPIYGMITRS